MTETGAAGDGRDRYPDSQHESHAPEGWTVYEEKNTAHVIFVHTRSEDLVHVEADGITPLVSLFTDGERALHRDANTWEDALSLASDIMTAYAQSLPADHISVPRDAVSELVDDVFYSITDGHYVGDHRDTTANAVASIYEAFDRTEEAAQARAIAQEAADGPHHV